MVTIGIIIWNEQIWFGIRIYYMFPLIFYCLVRFYNEEKAQWLWISGLVGIGSTTGTTYFVMLWIPMFMCMGIVLVYYKPSLIRTLFVTKRANISTFLLFIAVGLLLALTLSRAVQEIKINSSRSGQVQVTARDFVEHGGKLNLETVGSSMITGYPTAFAGSGADTSIYIGLFPLLLFIFGIHYRSSPVKQKPLFNSLLVGLLFLFTLALGGIFSRLYYFFPSLPYYRFIFFDLTLIRIFMILIAGFAFDKINRDGLPVKTFLFYIFVLLIGMDLLYVSQNLFKNLENITSLEIGFNQVLALSFDESWSYYFLIRVFIYLFFMPAFILANRINRFATDNLKAISSLLIILPILFDIVIFQYGVYQDYPRITLEDYVPNLTDVQENEYRSERLWTPATERQQDFVDIVNFLDKIPGNMTLYSLMQFEPCLSLYSTTLWSSKLYRYRNVLDHFDDSHFNLLFGCESPKLRMVKDLETIADDDIKTVLRTEVYNVQEVVLFVKEDFQVNDELYTQGENDDVLSYEINVSEFTEDYLKVQVSSNIGSWLIYSDAYNSHWIATINQLETPIYAAYDMFKAIWVESGENTIEFIYQPPYRLPFHLIFIFHNILGFVVFAIFIALWFSEHTLININTKLKSYIAR